MCLIKVTWKTCSVGRPPGIWLGTTDLDTTVSLRGVFAYLTTLLIGNEVQVFPITPPCLVAVAQGMPTRAPRTHEAHRGAIHATAAVNSAIHPNERDTA